MPTDYWHKAWTCPFAETSGKLWIKCEGGCRMGFPDAPTAKSFFGKFCASEEMGWKQCMIAAMLNAYYEEAFENEKKQRY